jgi:uncharacterized membrane protein
VQLPSNWPIKRCLIFCLIILLVMLGLAGLASSGFDIPVLQQVIGFIFLTFIPGVLILRILRIHKINLIEGLAYSVGLSLASVMFIGALVNFVLPILHIAEPISLLPITIVLGAYIVILMIIAYIRDRDYVDTAETKLLDKVQMAPILFLVLLLLLTILGITLIDDYQNNVLLLIVLLAIAGVIALAAFGKFIQPVIYPLALFIIGLCLLYQTSLLSPYLVGTDIYTEYHFYNLVASKGFWDSSIASPVNSCLSITVLAPIYMLLLNISGIWMFKVVYPLLFALVPVILFHIFNQQMSAKKAFLAAFFFISVPTFFLEMPALCRQQIAELFLALIILLLVDRRIYWRPRLTLVIIFSFSMIVAHYALGIIGFVYMVIGLSLIFLIRSQVFRRAWGWFTRKFGGLPENLTAPGALPGKGLIILIAVYVTFGIIWYATIASGVDLAQLNTIFKSQLNTITSGAGLLPNAFHTTLKFGPPASLIQTALGLDFAQSSIQGKIFRIFQYITELFLILGFFRLIFKPRGLRFTAEYIAFSVISALLILVSIFLPYFAVPLNITRIYHIALITLAPFCILGGEAVWLGIGSIWRRIKKRSGHKENEDNQTALRLIALAVLIPYFLFTSGLIYEVTGQKVTDKVDTPYSIALSSYRLDLAGVFNVRDGAAARWLMQKVTNETNVYVDSHSSKLLTFYEFPGKIEQLPGDAAKLKPYNYVYFTTWNVAKNEVTFTISRQPGLRQNVGFDDIPGLRTAIKSKNLIYEDGGAQILAP